VLQSNLSATKNVDLFCPSRIESIELGPEQASVTLSSDDGEQMLTCKLLVAADGTNSTVREMMGISAQQREYGQRAVVGNLLPEKNLNKRAFERFTPQGPLAILPIADDRAGCVWTVAEHDADRVMALDDDEFLAETQEGFGSRLGQFSRVG